VSSATFVALFIGALAVWFAVRVSAVLVLILLAVLLAVFLSSFTDVLERRFSMARGLGLTLAALGSTAAVFGLGALFVPPVVVQTRALITHLPQTLAGIQAALERLATQYPVLRDAALADPQSGILASATYDLTEFLRRAILPYIRTGGQLFLEGSAVVVMALYLARRPALYRDGMLALVSPKQRPLADRILVDAGATLRAWVAGQLLAMFILAALTALGLWALGVPYWLAFGLFTGLVALVPFFGSLVSTILPALFVIGTGSWLLVTAVLALGVVVHVVGTNLIVPLIMQRTVAVPPALTIAGVLVGGSLLGAVGLVVAVPLLALVLVLVRHILQREMYGEESTFQPTVLRASRGRQPPVLVSRP
jgi:predicted PurR-regulated permease PerM